MGLRDEDPADRARSCETAVDTWQIGRFEHDQVTGTIFGCARLREVYGFPVDHDITVESFAGSVHPEDRDLVVTHRAAAHDSAGDGHFSLRHRIIRPNGEERWIHFRSKTEFGEIDGKLAPLRTCGSVMDVTEGERTAQALRRNEERLDEALRASRVGLYEHQHGDAAKGAAPYWSPMLRSILGYSEDAPADFEWYAARVHPEDGGRLHAALAHATDPAGGGVIETEYRWRHSDGSLRWLHVRGTTHFGMVAGSRTALHAVGAILDVTERRQVAADLRRRSAILDATPDFVGITTGEGQIVYLNRAARTFLGLEADAELDNWDVSTAHPPDAARRIFEVGMPAARRDGVWKAETEFVRHDGVVVPMSQVLLAHCEPGANTTYFSTIARDLSREKALEEQFRQSQKMEAVGRLAGGVAHDFNNLLSAIMGFTNLAKARLDEANPARRDLAEVQLAAERAASLTRQLLALGRKQILQPCVLNLNGALTEMDPLIRRLVGESISTRLVLFPRPLNVKADPSQIQQILLNLVVNARDAMPDGGTITIESQLVSPRSDHTELALGLDPGEYAVIVVSDTGHGMRPEIQKRAFEPFFTTKGPGEGTGLGLSTVFGIVRQSDGAIGLESAEGQGTTFRIYLPCTDEAVAPQAARTATIGPSRGGVVLVAEDEDQLRRMVVEALERAGYKALAASTPAEALAIAHRQDGGIDLLLTDVVMPGMNGRQLADRLVQAYPQVDVLFMSGYTEDAIVHQGLLDPGVNFLAKPFTPMSMLEAVRSILERP